jgi:hypothetical protein
MEMVEVEEKHFAGKVERAGTGEIREGGTISRGVANI